MSFHACREVIPSLLICHSERSEESRSGLCRRVAQASFCDICELCFPLAAASSPSTKRRSIADMQTAACLRHPGENERAAAQAKENYISRHEQILEKEQERTQR